MNSNPHGVFDIQRHGELVVVRLKGAFNLEGARRLARGIHMFWNGCGEPERWPVLADLREWEGGTPETFGEAANTVQWMVEHGMVIEARVFTGNFLPRVLDQQPGMHVTSILTQNFTDIAAACDWLECQGCDCGEFRAQEGLLPARGCLAR